MEKLTYIGALGKNPNGYDKAKYQIEGEEYKENSGENPNLLRYLPIGEILFQKKDEIDQVIILGPKEIKFKGKDEKYTTKNLISENFGFDMEKIIVIDYYDIKKDYYEFYNQVVTKIVQENKDIILDISNGRRDVPNNLYNLIPAFENINNYKVQHVFYGFLDLDKHEAIHEIKDYKKHLDENKKVEKLKTFLNNYTVDVEFKGMIEKEKEFKDYLKIIQDFYDALHFNKLSEIRKKIKELKEYKLDETDSLIYDILDKIQIEFKGKYEDDNKFLNNLQKDLLEKEYYQQLITMLEGEFRKQVINNYTTINSEEINSMELYLLSDYLLKKGSNRQDKKIGNNIVKYEEKLAEYKIKSVFQNGNYKKWQDFKNFRNPLNHGTKLSDIKDKENVKKEFKENCDKIISLINKTEKKEL